MSLKNSSFFTPFYMKKCILCMLLLCSIVGYTQNKLNYGFILGADRFIGVNETNPEGFELKSQTIPKAGFFVEKTISEKYSYNLSLTYHYYLENYKYMNRVVDSDQRNLFEMAVGPNSYLNLNASVRYYLYNNLFVYGGGFLSYHYNGHTILTSTNPETDELAFILKKNGREDINGGLNFGFSYELNPKNKIVIEPFIHADFTVTNREKFKLTSYMGNAITEHKYKRLYFSFGMKFKLNRNK